ncbi:glycosyl hydrolase family 71-domain-containing protein [Triangularia setosa]|uniref:Glycosyl hydrolase family 71-domain-containing protein n=1 Tax=Triangularia setosa TaxID=2587417 RepID=A0AAN7A2B4_9PEZI|nr:glycosyl hydrolase family 71-domain-containing protein [Podospora setosa]
MHLSSLLLPLALAVLGGARYVLGKAVFAHFMVSNAANYTVENWEYDIQLAKDAHIDAFALNMAYNEGTDSVSIARNFKLFFSFDYAGRGPWPRAAVMSTILNYKDRSAHFRYNGQPFASTFEGPEQAQDWIDIKKVTGCFFVPDRSSVGAKAAMSLAGGVADGLFSWAAWPWGPQNMDTYVDASYLQYLNGKPYMMPVSPWFYTNLPQWKKNWMWRGDNLWFDRWQEVMYVQPEWVQIISWNDYGNILSRGRGLTRLQTGESHYIGPIRNNALAAMRSAPFDYVSNMPQDGWRPWLPYVSDMYRYNITLFDKEGVTFWYRPNPRSACGSGGTTGNTALQLQLEFPVAEVAADAVFYTCQRLRYTHLLYLHSGQLERLGWQRYVVCIRGTGANDFADMCAFSCSYGYCPIGACVCLAMVAGRSADYSGLCSFSCNLGKIGDRGCPSDICGTAEAPLVIPTVSPFLPFTCTGGQGPPGWEGLCSYACNFGFGPSNICTCTQTGALNVPPPKIRDTVGSSLNPKVNDWGLQLGARHHLITTTRIPVFNINITQAAINNVVFTVTPSIFCIAPITVGPPGVTVPSRSSSLITYSITSTPTPSTTPWPPITSTFKTKISFTSTSSVMPTCTSGCGDECAHNRNDCDVNCWFCLPSSGPPPGPPPPPGGGGGGGGGSDDDPSCTSRSAVVHTTVHCRLYSSSGKLTLETTCTSTESSTTSGCSMTPTRTTTYTSSNCPRLAGYKPAWSEYTGAVPTPGGPGWNVYTWATGTYTTKAPNTPNPTPTPTLNPNAKPLTRDDDTIGPGDAPIRFRRTDDKGVNYDFRVEWVAGCVTTVGRQSFRFPLGMTQSLITAYLLVRENYTKCK